MKRLFSLLLIFVLMFTFVVPTFGAEKKSSSKKSNEVTVVLRNYIDKNGNSVSSKKITFTKNEGIPINENGRILLPIRKIAEELGYIVDWDGPSDLSPYGVVTIRKTLKKDKNENINNVFNKYHQFNDYVYFIRQLDKGKNPTAFKLKESWSGETNMKVNTETFVDLDKDIDYLLYNTEEVEIATTLFTDGDFCNVSLNAWENQYNYFYTYQFTLDVEPKIINGRTMVPVRAASELLGLKVDWNGDTNTVTITA